MKPYTHTVCYYETDRMGITHHSNYIRWMEEARTDYLVQLGWPLEKLEEVGVVSPVTALEVKYQNTTTFADEVRIWVTLVQCTGVRLKLAYRMEKADGAPVFSGTSEHCFLDGNGRIVRLNREHPAFYQALLESGKSDES
ncbi:MAG: acyl-CoA thioesterase [Ruminiclostridium sp.]|nr:acyl-CoA thioesterase [Ruminiclostridium sp.]